VDSDILLWHWNQDEHHAHHLGLELAFSMDIAKKMMYPNTYTCWHYDSKISQKYLLESIGAPMPQTNVFYKKSDAEEFIENRKLPVVFKLSKGAGAQNVLLINKKNQGKRLIAKAFSKGFKVVPGYFKDTKTKLKKTKTLGSLILKASRAPFIIIQKIRYNKQFQPESQYFYVQNYLPKNKYDTRVIVIGNRAFALQRYNRANDFRASGSGLVNYNKEDIDLEIIKMSFDITKKIRSQSLALDFIYDENNQPNLIEISYCWLPGEFYRKCQGYWDNKLKWHEEPVTPEEFIIDDILNNYYAK
jgi:hypothetical protein